MEVANIQLLLFQHIKSQLPPHVSMVDKVADLLDVSSGSAYRRIRGEKPISVKELQVLATHFNISLDHLFNRNESNFIFNDNVIEKGKYDFGDHLEFHLLNMQFLKSAGSVEIIFFSRDIAIFYFYQFPELLAFKYFYWMQAVFGNPDFNKRKFLIEDNVHVFAEKGSIAARLYTELPSTEIWAIEHINLTLQQIQFYKETDMFSVPEEINVIYDKVEELVDHIEVQAEIGKKFFYKEEVKENAASFELYVNEFMIGGNNILVRANDRWFAYINHSIMNYLRTDDPVFCEYVLKRIQSVIKKSDLISAVGEKQRKNFFNRLRAKIAYSRKM